MVPIVHISYHFTELFPIIQRNVIIIIIILAKLIFSPSTGGVFPVNILITKQNKLITKDGTRREMN